MTRFGWRNSATPFIKRFIAEGTSAEAAMASLRQSGFKFRDSDFRATYREMQGQSARFASFKFINRDAKPTNELFTSIKPTWDEAYEYTVRVRGRSIATGESMTRNFSYRSNERLSRNQLVEEVRTWFGEGVTADTDRLEVLDVLAVEGYRNARVTD